MLIPVASLISGLVTFAITGDPVAAYSVAISVSAITRIGVGANDAYLKNVKKKAEDEEEEECVMKIIDSVIERRVRKENPIVMRDGDKERMIEKARLAKEVYQHNCLKFLFALCCLYIAHLLIRYLEEKN